GSWYTRARAPGAGSGKAAPTAMRAWRSTSPAASNTSPVRTAPGAKSVSRTGPDGGFVSGSDDRLTVTAAFETGCPGVVVTSVMAGPPLAFDRSMYDRKAASITESPLTTATVVGPAAGPLAALAARPRAASPLPA